MSSIYTPNPSQLHDDFLKGRLQDSRNISANNTTQQPFQPNTPADSQHHLSPYSSATQTQSSSTSPTQNTTTPSDSISALSVHYPSSEFSDVGDDPFFGVDFSNADGGTPSFLGDHPSPLTDFVGDLSRATSQAPAFTGRLSESSAQGYPLSPGQTASIHTASPPGDNRDSRRALQTNLPQSISPQELTKVPSSHSYPLEVDTTSITPNTAGSGRSSEEGLAPPASAMPCQSPRLTVSLWGRDNAVPISEIDPAFHSDSGSPTTVRGGNLAGDHNSSRDHSHPSQGHVLRNDQGHWVPNEASGPHGLDPVNRPAGETSSANDLAANRKSQQRNQHVSNWLSHSGEAEKPRNGKFVQQEGQPQSEGVSDREISPGDQTENIHQPGRTYYMEQGGQLTGQDIHIMHQNRNWEDAPALFHISRPDAGRHYQPQTAAEAMAKFERMCRDNDSILSRAATWGTRRRSLPSIADVEGITSGNFLKKLSISRGEPSRRPSILQEIRSRMRKPSTSQLLKRSRGAADEDESSSGPDSHGERRESRDSLSPTVRTSSWGKKQQPPSINTALVSMTQQVASIGTTHARSGSISTTPPVVSPKSPFSLKVGNIRRPRSKSDLPPTHANLVGMWKKTGGPPVATLAQPTSVPEPDDDEDEDEEGFDESDMKTEPIQMIDDITPNLEGFRLHVLKCNPMLEDNNKFLIERIMYQQQQRYKLLCGARVKHLGQVQQRTCPCGAMCIASGGSAIRLDNKGDSRGVDPLDGSDDDLTPLDGAIAQESFPADIPMPPTQSLPAEFECQLCFQPKKFQKPSDWTKHVHEDVQPFTCTWEKCRENKIFKRKADWVRHENEGHRHLEWWTCDVEDCRHICYRRDNFLQHLVREHKFPEPKVKTKAAIKRAGGNDPTWHKVESCHHDTPKRPQEEPCRFCGKTFPSWKKLTVHLAKHMEQLSLPILRLVARKELDADTIISPVTEPPARSFVVTPVKQEAPPFPSVSQAHFTQHPNSMPSTYPSQPGNDYMFPMQQQTPQQPQYQPQFYGNQYNNLHQNMPSIDTSMGAGHVNPGYAGHQQAFASMAGIPTGPGGYMSGNSAGGDAARYMPMTSNVEPFPSLPLTGLGLQNPSPHQMPYAGMMDPASAATEQHYMSQGSVSPFSHHSHSPHQGPSQFYSH